EARAARGTCYDGQSERRRAGSPIWIGRLLLLVGHTLERSPSDRAQHSVKDQVVNRVERVPVRKSCEAVGIEDRRLAQRRSGLVAVDLELKPDAPRGLHL